MSDSGHGAWMIGPREAYGVQLLTQLRDTQEADLPDGTPDLRGRWVLVRSGERPIAFSDAAGLRQVFHHRNHSGAVWLASGDALLATELGLPINEVAAKWLKRCQTRNPRARRKLPRNGSSHEGATRLLPNHLIDLGSGHVERHWPRGPLTPMDPGEAIDQLVHVFEGQMLAVKYRGIAATMLFTGGRDSRLVLSSAISTKTPVTALTFKMKGDRAEERLIPQRLSKSSGLSHLVLTPPSKPSSALWDTYQEFAPAAQPHYAANAEAMHTYVRDRLAITRHVSGVAKLHQGGISDSQPPAPNDSVKALGWPPEPFAVQSLAEWLDSTGEQGVNPKDLLYWEQRVGPWLASWMNESDPIWGDVLCPFDNRRLLTTMLSVNDSGAGRCSPDYRMRTTAIERMAPTLLSEPFGGNSRPRARKQVKRAIRGGLARLFPQAMDWPRSWLTHADTRLSASADPWVDGFDHDNRPPPPSAIGHFLEH